MRSPACSCWPAPAPSCSDATPVDGARRRRGAGGGAAGRATRAAGRPLSVRRLVVTVCLREPGVVLLPVERGGRARRLDAAAVLAELERVAARRGLGGHVQFRE